MEFIYFIEAPAFKAIKIGYTTNVKNRLRLIQSTTPFELKILAVREGSWTDEKKLLRKFRKFKINGEWFRDCDEIRKEAASLLPIEMNNFIEAEGTDKLREWLIAEGMTQQQMADLVGCDQTTISRAVKGLTISPKFMKSIAEVTKGAVTPNDLLGLTAG